MSSTQNLPPVDSSTVGPKAKALTALINQAATKASEGDRTAQALTLGNFPGNPSLDEAIHGIVFSILSSTYSMAGPPPQFTAVEQDEIYNAFKGFVQGFRQLVKSMVDKREVMAANPQKGDSLAGFLLSCKIFVNKFAVGIIAMLPARVDDAQLQMEPFNSSLNEAIEAFRS